jgi:hypothetical protein
VDLGANRSVIQVTNTERRVSYSDLQMIRPSRISFGGTAGIVTSMALIAGLDAARTSRASMVSALLIAAVADNLTDSLSVHMYQESERLEQKEAFIGTLSNFVTRLFLCLSFVLIVALLPGHMATMGGLAWGILLLVVLTCMLARYRGVSTISEVGKHLAVAFAIIIVSQRVGHWIAVHVI